MWELFKELGGTFRNHRADCNKLENIIAVCARTLGMQKPVHTITVTMFRASASDKPKFKGKVAETRHFLPILLEMLSKCFPSKLLVNICCFTVRRHYRSATKSWRIGAR